MNIDSFLTPAGPKAPVNKFWFTLGVIMAIFAVLGSLYLALWLCFIGGIVQVVEAVKATPVASLSLALGILRIVATAVVGWGCFFLSSFICGIFFTRAYAARAKQKMEHLTKMHNEFFGKS